MTASPPLGSARRETPETRATVLPGPPAMVLRRMARFGPLRFVIGNAAVRIEQHGELCGVDPEGRLALVGDAELWLFPEHWHPDFLMTELAGAEGLLRLQFFHASGDEVLQVVVDPHASSSSIPNLRAIIARWRTSRPAPVPVRRAARRADRASILAPGVELALARARRTGGVRAVQEIVGRYGLSRIDALSFLGDPWVYRVRCFAVTRLLEQIARRGLGVQLLIGNEGLTYVRQGPLPEPRCEGRNVVLRDANVSIEVRAAALDSLWAVRLRASGHEVSSLEAYDAEGSPAVLMFGTRDRAGGESPAWRAFVDRRRADGAGRDGVGIRDVSTAPGPHARGGAQPSLQED